MWDILHVQSFCCVSSLRSLFVISDSQYMYYVMNAMYILYTSHIFTSSLWACNGWNVNRCYLPAQFDGNASGSSNCIWRKTTDRMNKSITLKSSTTIVLGSISIYSAVSKKIEMYTHFWTTQYFYYNTISFTSCVEC